MAKGKINATIEEKILNNWNSYCEQRYINRSKLLEKLISDYLKKEKGGKNE